MNTQTIHEMITKNAVELKRLHVDLHRKHKLRADGPEAVAAWHEAVALFRSCYNELAFPGGYDGALERLLKGDALAMEASICFLEVRPFFFHSGFMFKDILRKSRKAPLTEDQLKRLAVVELAVVQWRSRKRNAQQNSSPTKQEASTEEPL